jgi:hypothetical protein
MSTRWCPKCGCRAMFVVMTAKVKCELNDDFTLGRTVHVGKRVETSPAEYVCGGGHTFTGVEPTEHGDR